MNTVIAWPSLNLGNRLTLCFYILEKNVRIELDKAVFTRK